MPVFSLPSFPLPEPLCAAEEPSFTHHSVVVRLPEIARRTLAENCFSPAVTARIQTLIDEIPHGKIRALHLPNAGGSARWEEDLQPYLGMNWLEVPWFFAEEYFYVRILEATGYFDKAGPGFVCDPYAGQKRLGLESSRDAIRKLAEQIHRVAVYPQSEQGTAAFREALTRLLLLDLWGNQNDLSMWPVQAGANGSQTSGGSAGAGEDLQAFHARILADDTPALLEYLEQLPHKGSQPMRVDILLDNAGYELVSDLALADFLLASGRVEQVVLHAKSYPVFVSDVIEADIHNTLDDLLHDNNAASRALAIRLRTHLLSERLQVRHHPFWTSPLPAWEIPAALAEDIRAASLLISKGDANYRRLLGDRHWRFDQPFGQVVDYFPIGLLALRTLKSEIAVGIPAEAAPGSDPHWMTNGRWGLIQFAAPRIRL